MCIMRDWRVASPGTRTARGAVLDALGAFDGEANTIRSCVDLNTGVTYVSLERAELQLLHEWANGSRLIDHPGESAAGAVSVQ